MARAADYDIVSDAKVSLKIGGDIDRDFPIGMSSPDVTQRSILSFMVDTVGASNLTFRLEIVNGNGVKTEVIAITTNSAVARTFQEVINGNVLTPTNNTLKVKVLSGGGTLEISDIVLWYLKNV
jgi:hypothetical protein